MRARSRHNPPEMIIHRGARILYNSFPRSQWQCALRVLATECPPPHFKGGMKRRDEPLQFCPILTTSPLCLKSMGLCVVGLGPVSHVNLLKVMREFSSSPVCISQLSPSIYLNSISYLLYLTCFFFFICYPPFFTVLLFHFFPYFSTLSIPFFILHFS